MPIVIYSPSKDGHHDSSIDAQVTRFLAKLFQDDTLPGLHIEPINNSIDSRVRTGRVNQFYRAVLFKILPSEGEPHYVYSGVWPHDEAIEVAKTSYLKTNPVNGLSELIRTSTPTIAEPEPPAPAADSSPSEPEPEEPAHPFLESVSADISFDELVNTLGMDETLATQAMQATTRAELDTLAEDAVTWQGVALLSLAEGATIADVIEELGLRPAEEVAAGGSEDDKLLAGFRQPAAQMQFAWFDDDKELRRVIEEGDFARWRTFLHPEQRKYATRDYNGPFRLTGGAGTGKTVVLLHRARNLALENPKARIVLATYTRNLADEMKRQLRLLDAELPIAKKLGEPGIFVTGVDSAAWAVKARASMPQLEAAAEAVLGIGGNRAINMNPKPMNAWREAVTMAGPNDDADTYTAAFMDAEYALVVLPNRIRTQDEYFKVRRPGRGVRMGRAQRLAAWRIIDAYRAAAAVNNAVDYEEIAAIAAELCAGPVGPLADHVLVDEGQDLTPAKWQFLRALAAPGVNDMFIAEDAHQRIYGQPVVLGRLGIKIVGRARRLTLNYRTTQQVLAYATGVLEGSSYLNSEGELVEDVGYWSARGGPDPRIIAAQSPREELDRAAEVIDAWLDEGVDPPTIGILVRDSNQADRLQRELEDRDVDVRVVTKSANISKRPQVMTMHRAKGMEFSRVLLFGMGADSLPAKHILASVPEEDRADVMQRERSLLYVAATRARDELVVMWSGEPSELLGA